MDDYYQLARKLGGMDRQSLATELRALHQQTVDAVIERAAGIVREGAEACDSPEYVESSIRALRLRGSQIADDRMHLRHAEAVLYALTRIHRPLVVRRADVRGAFDAGHGVDIVRSVDDYMKVAAQSGKYKGE